MNDNAQTAMLLKIAASAIEASQLARAAAAEKHDLRQAYRDHKEMVGVKKVERNTPEWSAMLAATVGEYAVSKAAKQQAQNATRRLQTAIRRYENSAL